MKTASPSASSATPRPTWATCAPTPTAIRATPTWRSSTAAASASPSRGRYHPGDILEVHPFGNALCVVEATGQQILDALEWGARNVPVENGGFLQVSGLTYEIHTYIESSCTADENGLFTGVDGEYPRQERQGSPARTST